MPQRLPEGVQRTLVLSLGDMGLAVATRLRSQLIAAYGSLEALPMAAFLHLEPPGGGPPAAGSTSPEELAAMVRGCPGAAPDGPDCLTLGLDGLPEALAAWQGQAAGRWLPPAVLAREAVAAGDVQTLRGVGRALFWHHQARIAGRVHQVLRQLLGAGVDARMLTRWGQRLAPGLRIYLIAHLGDGFPSGAHLEAACLVKRLCLEVDPVALPNLVGCLVIPSIDRAQPAWWARNARAALSELEGLAAHWSGELDWPAPAPWATPLELGADPMKIVAGTPYHQTWLLQQENPDLTRDEMADLEALLAETLLGDLLHETGAFRRAMDRQLDQQADQLSGQPYHLGYATLGRAELSASQRALGDLFAGHRALGQVGRWLGVSADVLSLAGVIASGESSADLSERLHGCFKAGANPVADAEDEAAPPAWLPDGDLARQLHETLQAGPVSPLQAALGIPRRRRRDRVVLSAQLQELWALQEAFLAWPEDSLPEGSGFAGLETANAWYHDAARAVEVNLAAARAEGGLLAEVRLLSAMQGQLRACRRHQAPQQKMSRPPGRREAPYRTTVEQLLASLETDLPPLGLLDFCGWAALAERRREALNAMARWSAERLAAAVDWQTERWTQHLWADLEAHRARLEEQWERLARAAGSLADRVREDWNAARSWRVPGWNLLGDPGCRLPELLAELEQRERGPAVAAGLAAGSAPPWPDPGRKIPPEKLAVALLETSHQTLRQPLQDWLPNVLDLGAFVYPQADERELLWRLLIEMAEPCGRLASHATGPGWQLTAEYPNGPLRQWLLGLPAGVQDRPDATPPVEELVKAGWPDGKAIVTLRGADRLLLLTLQVSFPLHALVVADNYEAAWSLVTDPAEREACGGQHPLVATAFPPLLLLDPQRLEAARRARALGAMAELLREVPWPEGPLASCLAWFPPGQASERLTIHWSALLRVLAERPDLCQAIEAAAWTRLEPLSPAARAERIEDWCATWREHLERQPTPPPAELQKTWLADEAQRLGALLEVGSADA